MIPSPTHSPRMLSPRDFNLTELKFEDTNTGDGDSSSLIWVILFSILMILSIVSNTIYIVSLSTRTITTTHIIICCFFLINLVDYCLMIFEFSLGGDNQFPYTDTACSLYQFLLQLCPLLTAAALLLLVLHAFGCRVFSSLARSLASVGTSLAVAGLLVLPSLLYSEVAVYPSSARHCVVDMSGAGAGLGLGLSWGTQHIPTAAYTLLHRAVLAFLLPGLLVLGPSLRLVARVNTAQDPDLRVSLSLAVAISFLVFNLPLAAVSAVRQVFLIQSPPMAYKEKYLMDVMESLFKLLSFFFHVFRPLVCLVLEHGASLSHDDFILNAKLQSEHKKLLKRDEEN